MIKVQVFSNGKYILRRTVNLDETPPEGVDNEEFNHFQIQELLRGILRSIDPTDWYRLDLTRRPEQGGLPHGKEDEGQDLGSQGEEDTA